MQPASSSSTPVGSSSSASTEEKEAAANNSPRRKRRRMATGHGVQQIPETSAVLLPPQQQEQPTLPPVKQRRVAEYQAPAADSFAGAEPTETNRPEPITAFAEAPIADEPMATEAGPAAEEIPLEDIITNFLPSQQEEIQKHLNDEGIQQVLNEVKNLLTLLRESGIKLSPGRGRIPTPSLFGRLRCLTLPEDAALIRKFFEKATIFFSAVNPAQIKNTGCLSTMLDSKTHITNFANETEDNLRLLASHPYLTQITSMCNRKGVPDPVKAAEITKWDCWKIDGTFNLELMRAFSSMMSGRGLINDQAQVVEMLAWECWQLDGEFSMELLRAVSSMMNCRGFPDKKTLTAMLVWDCWKIDGKFSFDLLRTFSSMSSGKGLIKQAEVERVLAWPCWQVSGKFSLDLLRIFSSMSSRRGLLKDEARINAILAWECWKIEGEFSIELLRTVASMLTGRGLPEKEPTENFLSWPCWQVDGKFSFDLLRCFSSMSHTRGLIKQAEVERILVWSCWQVNGKFSLDLLRIFSSMMNSRGLLKDEALITDMLAWDCWKIDGKFSIELLRTFSSMMNGCGIPQKEKVAAILVWPCWQIDGKFSIDLLRTFSSMFHSRGLIKQAEVERVLAWPCWKIDGKFSFELLRIFSSMTSGRGLLKDEARINAILVWECWKIEGEFSVKLLRTVASMLSGRGLPEKEPTENLLSWPCWQVDGKFSIELLRTFSSMMHGCGIPQKEKVEAILAWPCLKIDGKFSFELLRIFSSMTSGRGLLKDEARINAILVWECWTIEGEFSVELLRTVASMLSGRGLPEKEPTENLLSWPCWQVDGKISIELLRIFSSMMSGCGIPQKEKVEAILAWPCWKIDGKFSFELLRTVSSMSHGRGLIKQAEVESVLAWPCWQVNGKVSIDRLRIVAVMMHSKGMPDQATAEAFLAWLPLRTETSDKGQVHLRSAWRALASTGVPDPKMLADIETALRPCFMEDTVDDDEYSSDSEDELSEIGQLKALTLFCAASAKWQKNLVEIQKFLAAYNTTSCSQTVVHTIMDSLIQILANHGQAGVQLWLEHHSRQPNSRGCLSTALSISAPLALAKFALKQLPESEWQDYIALCKNLLPTPDKKQWQALKPLRDLLNKRFSLTVSKRTMLEILWSHSDRNQPRYHQKINALLKILPTTAQLNRLQQAFGQKKMQAFLDACLTWQNAVQQNANPAVVPELKTQELLLEGLLVANHYLSKYEQIPTLCFSKQVAGANGFGVIVDGDAEMSGHQRLWHFIAAMLIELNQTKYQFKRQQLRISPPDSEAIILPKPEFTGTRTGFVITNWSLEQLTAFFRATEFTEHWYKNPDDTRDISAIRREQRLLQMRARPQNTTQTGYKAGPIRVRSLLPPSVIINIIKQGIRLKSTVWSSLEHYAKNGQLSDTLCRLLAPIIEKELASTVPDAVPEIVKKTVAQRLRQTGTSQTAAVATATQLPSSTSTFAATPSPFTSPLMSPLQLLPATQDVAIDMALGTMARDMALEGLEYFPVLGSAELAILEPWRDQMTYSQLMDVITKIDLQSVERETVLVWQQTFENRRRDPLDLDLDEFLDSLLEGGC